MPGLLTRPVAAWKAARRPVAAALSAATQPCRALAAGISARVLAHFEYLCDIPVIPVAAVSARSGAESVSPFGHRNHPDIRAARSFWTA